MVDIHPCISCGRRTLAQIMIRILTVMKKKKKKSRQHLADNIRMPSRQKNGKYLSKWFLYWSTLFQLTNLLPNHVIVWYTDERFAES